MAGNMIKAEEHAGRNRRLWRRRFSPDIAVYLLRVTFALLASLPRRLGPGGSVDAYRLQQAEGTVSTAIEMGTMSSSLLHEQLDDDVVMGLAKLNTACLISSAMGRVVSMAI